MPIETMAGTSLQLACSVRIMTTPTASHMTATTARKPGLEGRRPIATGLSGSRDRGFRGAFLLPDLAVFPFGAPAFGVVRPLEPALRSLVAMSANVSAR